MVTRRARYTGEMSGRTGVSSRGEGTIVWFDPKTRCGFVKLDEDDREIFAQSERGVEVAFKEGDRVEYELRPWGNPPRAEAFIRPKRAT